MPLLSSAATFGIVAIIILRVLIALCTRTFFQPDEYFQSLEVSHYAVFSYGHLTWEWRRDPPIRSVIYPALNIPVYRTLQVLDLDETALLIYGPRFLHGLLAACTDIWLRALTKKTVGERYAKTAVFLSVTSFFHALSLSRSISNSLETSLTIIALSYYPWVQSLSLDRINLRICFAFAALACAVRPTNAVIWAYMTAILLWRLRSRIPDAFLVVGDLALIGTVTLCAIFAIDSAFYSKPTFTPLNFLLTNLSSVSLFYGTSPWHYYLTQGLPILCTTTLPFVLHGAYLVLGPSGTQATKTLVGLVVWTIGVFSLAGHKEWRFLHPLLPLMHVLAAKSLVDLSNRKPDKAHPSHNSLRPPIRRSHMFIVLLTIPLTIYALFFHARAQIGVMYYLREIPADELNSIGFLMPCHSTPWQAYLHKPELAHPGKMWALGCEPPLANHDLDSYQDQTDIFFDSPLTYLETRFPESVDPAFPPSPFPCSVPGTTPLEDKSWKHEWPKHLVMFGALLEADGGQVQGLLMQKGYREAWVGKNGWEEDWRRRGGVRVWRYTDSID